MAPVALPECVPLCGAQGRALGALRFVTGVPFPAVSGVAALWLRDLPFSISAAVGFIAVSDVAVLGDMVLASTIRRALDVGVEVRAVIRRRRWSTFGRC